MERVARATLAGLLIAGLPCACSTSPGGAPDAGAANNELTSCPPAPIENESWGRPCHDLYCPYASPNGFAGKFSNTCAGAEVTGDCSNGTFEVVANAVLCCAGTPSQVKWCAQGVVDGEACNEPDNSECVLPDESATCACDAPGPEWRCLPLDGGVSYCDCDAGLCTGPNP